MNNKKNNKNVFNPVNLGEVCKMDDAFYGATYEGEMHIVHLALPIFETQPTNLRNKIKMVCESENVRPTRIHMHSHYPTVLALVSDDEKAKKIIDSLHELMSEDLVAMLVLAEESFHLRDLKIGKNPRMLSSYRSFETDADLSPMSQIQFNILQNVASNVLGVITERVCNLCPEIIQQAKNYESFHTITLHFEGFQPVEVELMIHIVPVDSTERTIKFVSGLWATHNRSTMNVITTVSTANVFLVDASLKSDIHCN